MNLSPAHYELRSKGKHERCRTMASASTLGKAAKPIRRLAARGRGALVIEVTRAGHRVGFISLKKVREQQRHPTGMERKRR